MATRKISELTAITAITADDLLLVVDGAATTNKITAVNAANSIVNLPLTIPTIIQTALNDKLDASAYSAAGISAKTPVVAATVSSITLATTFAGSIIDGVTLVAGDRLLVKNQGTVSANGIYVISASPTAPARATDFDSSTEINNGFVLVNGGTTQRGSGWIVQSTVTTVGTDDIIFVQFSSSLVGLNAASVGLGNVNNTSDLNKPISTATSTALAAKQNTITGAATTITTNNLTVNRALVSGGIGKVAVSTVTSSELGFLSGVTSAIQTQLNSKAALSSPTFTGTPVLPSATIVGTGTTTLASFGIPAGAVMSFAMNSAPTGWLAADGSAVSRTTYATLFAAIGTTYGSGDGTTFNLPDMRGYFVRGSGTNGDGTVAGSFGAKQDDAFKSHSHIYRDPVEPAQPATRGIGGGTPVGFSATTVYVSDTPSDTTSAVGGVETRPKNIAMLYCIKF
jgi:microcystin-dependent protein